MTTAAYPRWVYLLVILLLERGDNDALNLVPYDVQLGAKAIADHQARDKR